MKTFIIYTESGSFKVNATDKKDANFKGRFNCRMSNDRFLRSRLAK